MRSRFLLGDSRYLLSSLRKNLGVETPSLFWCLNDCAFATRRAAFVLVLAESVDDGLLSCALFARLGCDPYKAFFSSPTLQNRENEQIWLSVYTHPHIHNTITTEQQHQEGPAQRACKRGQQRQSNGHNEITKPVYNKKKKKEKQNSNQNSDELTVNYGARACGTAQRQILAVPAIPASRQYCADRGNVCPEYHLDGCPFPCLHRRTFLAEQLERFRYGWRRKYSDGGVHKRVPCRNDHGYWHYTGRQFRYATRRCPAALATEAYCSNNCDWWSSWEVFDPRNSTVT